MNIPKIIIEVNSGCNTCGKSLVTVPAAGGCGCHSAQIPCNDNTPNSPCVECEHPCDDQTSSECWRYDGGDIPALSIKNGDLGTKVIITLAAEIIAIKQRLATANIP